MADSVERPARTGAPRPRAARRVRSRRATRRGRFTPGRVLSSLWNRGATEAALLVTAAAIASGVVFGAGVARATSETSDGQTWVGASDGTIVQINPVTGEPVSKVEIPIPGEVTVQQGEGIVLVTSPTSGETVSIDVGQMAASQARTDDPATRKPLLKHGRTYVAELDTGLVRIVDTSTMVDTGETYVGKAPLADVVVDDADTVWVLSADGTLTSIRYSDDAGRFITEDTTSVQGVEEASRMIPHPQGVTVLSPSSRALVQIGTGADVAAVVEGMDSEVLPAESSPRDLAAATISSRKAVVILDGDVVRMADMAAAGCDDPGRPAVFADRIYVPCNGQGRTMVLDRQGRSAREDIVTGGDETPQIVRDDDALVVSSPGSDGAVTVDSQGRQHRTEIRDTALPVRKPTKIDPAKTAASATPTAPTPDVPSSEPSDSSASSAPSDPPSSDEPSDELSSEPPELPPPDVPSSDPQTPPTGPSPGGPPSGTPPTTGGTAPGAGIDGPRDVRADSVGPAVAVVSWSAPGRAPESYTIRTTDGAGSTQVDGSARSASVTVGGRPSAQFVVIADFGADGQVQSQPSNTVTWGAGTSTAGTTRTAATTPRTSTPRTGTPRSTVAPTTNSTPRTSGNAPCNGVTCTTRPSGPNPQCRPAGDGPHSTCSTRTSETSTSATPTITTPTITTPTITTPTITTPPITTPPITTPITRTRTTTEPPTTRTTITPTTPTTTAAPPTTPTATAAPAPATTAAPPPATTVAPPPATTAAPPPATTAAPPPATTVAPPPEPTPPGAPDLSTYPEQSGEVNAAWAQWTAEANTTYTLTFQKGTGTVTTVDPASSPSSKDFGMLAGTVTVSLTAHRDGLSSAPVVQEVYLEPIDQCNPLHGSSWLQRPMDCSCPPQSGPPYTQCQIPLRNGGTGWLQPATAAPAAQLENPLRRYGSAVGLILLAGVVRWGRRRGQHEAEPVARVTPGTGIEENRS